MKTLTPRRKSVSVSNSRWLAYATAGAATAVAGVNSSEAAIHYSGVINQVFNAPATNTVHATFALSNAAVLRFVHTRASAGHPSSHGAALFRIEGAALSNMFVGTAAGFDRYPFRLASNVILNTTTPFNAMQGSSFAELAFHGGQTNDHWLEAGTAFIGFRFNSGSGMQFGWARLTMDGAPGNSFTLVDYGWGDAGTQIATGQVPEPGSLALLAIGAAGLVAWRRQRAKRAV
jgi:PEP-CTERM motif-containing protein